MSAMSALGLAGYSSSDAEEQDTGLGLGTDMTNASLANASIQMPAAAEHIRATASEPIASDTFGRFGRYKKRVKVTRRGLPLFSDPVDAGDRSDSGDEVWGVCRALGIRHQNSIMLHALNYVGDFRLSSVVSAPELLGPRGSRFYLRQYAHCPYTNRSKHQSKWYRHLQTWLPQKRQKCTGLV